MTTISSKVSAWTRRKCDGKLMFPRTVAAHLYEIDAYDSSYSQRATFSKLIITKEIIYQNEKVQINE